MSVIILRLLGVQELPKSQVNYFLMQNFLRKASLRVCVCVCSVTSVVSDSLQHRGLYPARLLCPWNSPGKNTGVGSHALSRKSSQPGIELESPALQVDSLSLDYRVSPKESIVPTEF